MSILLRAMQRDDEPFLYRLYASCRCDEMALLDWTDLEKDAFLRMQFNVQYRHYAAQFREAHFDVIERDGQPIGRLYLDHQSGEVRIIDISLLPEERGKGIGEGLIRETLALGSASGVPVTLHVDRSNRAVQLYRRLGFREVRRDDIYLCMEWGPECPARAADYSRQALASNSLSM